MINRKQFTISVLLAFVLSLNAASAHADFLTEAEQIANAAKARAASVARAIVRSRGVSPSVANSSVATRQAAATATRTASSVGTRAATFSAEAAQVLSAASGVLATFLLMTDSTFRQITGDVPTAANDVDVKRVESLDQAPLEQAVPVVNSGNAAT